MAGRRKGSKDGKPRKRRPPTAEELMRQEEARKKKKEEKIKSNPNNISKFFVANRNSGNGDEPTVMMQCSNEGESNAASVSPAISVQLGENNDKGDKA